MQELILRLASRSLQISRRGLVGEPANFQAPDVSRYMSPLAALAMEGDENCRQQFSDKLLAMAESQWGIATAGVPGNYLSDAFCMRSVTEAFKLLLAKNLIEPQRVEPICRWLFELARLRIDGRIQKQPKFESWMNRNQNVPATFLYEVADLIEHCPWATSMDYQSLYDWSDAQMVGWDLNWRSPDDSWLYQFIWAWGAYRHACIRQPHLLKTDNAIRSTTFYKTLYCPDDQPIVLGDANPHDYIGPAVGLMLGAQLSDDGQMTWLAQRMLRQVDALGDCHALVQRGPEFHRLYTMAQTCPQPQQFDHAPSEYMTSPIAGRGWSIGDTIYNFQIKTTDPRFPAIGRNVYDFDELYQIQDPSKYQTKPDKIVFRKSIKPGSFFALADLRAQGLHDHPDVPGIALLTRQGLPWLLESVYMPREKNRVRWLHNVPLYRRGHVEMASLLSPHSDTWREPAMDGVYFQTNAQHDEAFSKNTQADIARVLIPHDAFDYVDFDGDAFTMDRTFIYFHANDALLVVDRLISAITGSATIAQAWHSPAQVKLETHGFELTQPLDSASHTLPVATASSVDLKTHVGQHLPTERGGFHYQGPLNDLLFYAHVQTRSDELYSIAAGFGIVPGQLKITQEHMTTHIRCANNAITIGENLNDVKLVELDPGSD